jgi:hypothetical protein
MPTASAFEIPGFVLETSPEIAKLICNGVIGDP